MKRLLNYMVILSLSLFVFGCDFDSTEEIYLKKAFEITGNAWYGACRVGNANGNASFIYSSNSGREQVCVDYSAMGYSATECGGLFNLKLVDDGKNDTYRIKGGWYNKDSGSGHFRLEVLGEDAPNTIYLGIEGRGWKYWANMELSEEEFTEYITALSRASEEESNSDESIEEEVTEDWYREMDEEEKELFRQYD